MSIRRAFPVVVVSSMLMAGLVGLASPAGAMAGVGVTVSGGASPFTLSPTTLDLSVGDAFDIGDEITAPAGDVYIVGAITRISDSRDCSTFCVLTKGSATSYVIDATSDVSIYEYPGGAPGPLIGTLTFGGGTPVVDPSSYPKVTFYFNGGKCSSAFESIQAAPGFQYRTPASCTNGSKLLVGWATSGNATTAQYAPGQLLDLTDSIGLYAVWNANEFTVTYDANVGMETACLDAAGANQTTAAARKQQVTVSRSQADFTLPTAAVCVPNGFQLSGWRLSAIDSVQSPGTKVKVADFASQGSVTFAAVWVHPPTSERSILLTCKRTLVSGKSGVVCSGTTSGFATGDIVHPLVKLAGQSVYSMGVDKAVEADGTFTWQRKTGKKAFVYFESEDGAVKSLTVVVPTD